VSELQTAMGDSTRFVADAAASILLPLALVADSNARSRARRAAQLLKRGFRVAIARTSFEAIVKAACEIPDLILVDSSLGEGADETAELISTCPTTAHIPIFRLAPGRRLPSRLLAPAH